MSATAIHQPISTAPHATPASVLHASAAPAISRAARWTSRILTVLLAAFLVMDGGGRLAHFAPYVDGLVQAGYPAHLGVPIGLALIASTILYLIPRTAVLGAILLTGYFVGATATQVRLEDPWFLFPVAFGVLTWLALYLRDRRLRSILPLTR